MNCGGRTVQREKTLAKCGALRQNSTMKRFLVLLGLSWLCFAFVVFGQGKIDLQQSDTIQAILQKNVGQSVELRMKAGEKIGGKIEKVGDKMVHLSRLTGAEFFDAAVDIGEIAAVVVRTQTR
jgi:hypothetical protein